MEIEITYKGLSSLLSRVNLYIANKTWEVAEDERLLLTAEISGKSLNETPTLKEGAVHGTIRSFGTTPDELASKLLRKMKTADMLIGRYNDYTARIMWDGKRFEKIPLSQNEKIEYNCPL